MNLPATTTGPAPSNATPASRHWPALDGLRAVAVLAVLGKHVLVLTGGSLGVDVFFVLSGFLITSLLINEWDKRSGRISFRNFYLRRVLRLSPALLCLILAATLMALILDVIGGGVEHSFARATLGAIPWTLLFVANFVRVLHPADPFPLGVLGYTWSLAIEEQFYLLWPWIFALVSRRRFSRPGLALVLAGLAAAEMLYRAVLAHLGAGQVRISYGTDTHSDGLLLGCAVAFWLASDQSSWLHRTATRLGKAAVWLAGAVLIVLFCFENHSEDWFQISISVVASALLVVGIVLGQTPAAMQRFLCAGFMIRVGRRSYGLYLWQLLFIRSAELAALATLGDYNASQGKRILFSLLLVVAVIASFVVTDLSYRFIELPVLRAKRRFQP